MNPTTPPSPLQLPEEAFVGDPGEYIKTVDPVFRKPLCVYALRLIALFRASAADDGEQLKALARLEAAVTSSLQEATKEQPLRTGYAPV